MIEFMDFLGRHAETFWTLAVLFQAAAITPMLRHIKAARKWRQDMTDDMWLVKVKLGMIRETQVSDVPSKP